MNARELKEKYPKRFESEYCKWAAHAADYEWWDSEFQIAEEEGKKLGFDINDIRFSGFWSQGDGASWDGRINIPEFIVAHNLLTDPRWFLIHELSRGEYIDRYVVVGLSGSRCVNKWAMRLDTGMQVHSDGVIDYGVFKGAVVLDLLDAHGGEEMLVEVEEEMLDAAKEFAQEIYSTLGETYEALTSEEAFIEDCECNDATFEEDE